MEVYLHFPLRFQNAALNRGMRLHAIYLVNFTFVVGPNCLVTFSLFQISSVVRRCTAYGLGGFLRHH
jgi:hypothetical protein